MRKAIALTCIATAGFATSAAWGQSGNHLEIVHHPNYDKSVFMPFSPAIKIKSGKVRVTRAVAAVDAGQVVNPDGVVNQIEGGLIQSASWTLKEALRFDRTRVTTRSWADYPILRFEEVPQVEVVILNQPNERFLGVGEGAQGPAAAAIANAIANATGVRLRSLPFTPARVKAALA